MLSEINERFNWNDPEMHTVFMDKWSFLHIAFGVLGVFVLPPFWALMLLVLYEPFEVLILSPFLAQYGINYGYETVQNTLMDIVFDILGVLLGIFLVAPLMGWPIEAAAF